MTSATSLAERTSNVPRRSSCAATPLPISAWQGGFADQSAGDDRPAQDRDRRRRRRPAAPEIAAAFASHPARRARRRR